MVKVFDEPKYPEVDPNKKNPQVVWEERYGQPGYLFGKEPVSLLKTFVGVLTPGKALDVAMGEGRNAAFLAQSGFQVEGLDGSAKAVAKAKLLQEEKKVAFEAKVQNLDFFLMPLMKYQTIVMTYYKPAARFFSEIKRGLVMGGTVAIEAHTVEHLKHNGAQNPNLDLDQCYKPNELLSALKDFHILYYKELNEGGDCLVQVLAKKIR